jgi:hypothetical protein
MTGVVERKKKEREKKKMRYPIVMWRNSELLSDFMTCRGMVSATLANTDDGGVAHSPQCTVKCILLHPLAYITITHHGANLWTFQR